MQSIANFSWYYADYSSFVVSSEASNYMISVSGYSYGNNIGDGFSFHDGMMFTTYDRDNDPWTNTAHRNNCAVLYGGGIWYKDCARVGLNAVRDINHKFRWHSSQMGTLQFQSTRMWLTC